MDSALIFRQSPLSMKSFEPLRAPITVGIVGLGRAGWRLHFEPLLKIGEFKIVAVADPLSERAREAADKTGCKTFANIDELLSGSDAQVVVVATPSATHYSDVKKVLEAGRHCIAEKPLAYTAAEAGELVSLARERGLGLFINHAHLHGPIFYHLKQVIESGEIGDLFTLRVCWGGYARRWDWQTLKKNGGGQLNNTCPHAFSIVLPLLGSRVKSVFADLRHIKDAGDAEDHVHVVLKAESGVTADIVVSSALALAGPRYLVCGTRGALMTDGSKGTIRFYNADDAPPLTLLDGAAPGRQYLQETLPWQEREILASEQAPVPPLHQNVLDVLTGKVAEPIVTPESAAEVVRVTELLSKAAEE